MISSPGRAERQLVPDVLRGVAIIFMLLSHASPAWRTAPRPMIFVLGNVSGMATSLFTLVAGMSLQLLLTRTSGQRAWVFPLQQTIRGVVLIALGLWLTWLGSWVVVILPYLGVVLIVGAPLLLLPTRAVAAICAALWLASGAINDWARSLPLPQHDVLIRILDWLVLGPHYRLTTLLPFFLLGALLARHGFRRDRLLWGMLAIAPVAYLTGPLGERLLGWPDRLSGQYTDTLHDIGLAFAAYSVIVLLASIERAPWRTIVAAAFTPVRLLGRVALSLYVLHVTLIHFWLLSDWPASPYSPLLWLSVVVGVPVVGLLWWQFVGTGPLEWLLGAVTGRRKPLLRARRPRAASPAPAPG
ncbi:MAG TPA: heparan-alpha-glucosaminide N-acetyltransferase domain-containing protein [Arachnia sp.]|nr:heparan-alpha-glucosaminide N-acetyltransferase domain-containing protein [Arachnia sp.]HMT87767.1 heparan-alpha-glucosaminide N-acetyltransferase domain-containing protein [Arachnia sp.]